MSNKEKIIEEFLSKIEELEQQQAAPRSLDSKEESLSSGNSHTHFAPANYNNHSHSIPSSYYATSAIDYANQTAKFSSATELYARKNKTLSEIEMVNKLFLKILNPFMSIR